MHDGLVYIAFQSQRVTASQPITVTSQSSIQHEGRLQEGKANCNSYLWTTPNVEKDEGLAEDADQ